LLREKRITYFPQENYETPENLKHTRQSSFSFFNQKRLFDKITISNTSMFGKVLNDVLLSLQFYEVGATHI
jgi:hypothetical protein